MQFYVVANLEDWRNKARILLNNKTHYRTVRFEDTGSQQNLFGAESEISDLKESQSKSKKLVPKAFLSLAEAVQYHRLTNRWDLLYRVLWRITNGEPVLLEITTDDDVLALRNIEKEVRRDAHKMKAFVRFRKVNIEGEDHYIAWHRPDHRIVRKVSPFFSRRFKSMNWTILTPDESVSWDQQKLSYFEGVPRSESPTSDELEDLWKTYYGSIFNPARIKVKMMRSEMPVRHWATLPETDIINDLLQVAPERVQQMIEREEGYATTAADVIQSLKISTLEELKAAALGCQACDLYKHATQTVFGEGPVDARIVIVGEQPGDLEDLDGKPFVGPAGRILDEALAAGGIDRKDVYVTNVVKHFKFQSGPNKDNRIHRNPNKREVRCCRPWFDAEWAMLKKADVLICLGATAATALISPEFRLTQQMGDFIATRYSPFTIATWHPAAILRMPDATKRAERKQQLIQTLIKAKAIL